MSPKSAARERTIRRIIGPGLNYFERGYLPLMAYDFPLYQTKARFNMRQKQTAKKARRIVSAATRDHSRFVYDCVLLPTNAWLMKRN